MKRKIRRHLILMKHYKQRTGYSCGLACLRMLLERFGLDYSEKYLRNLVDFVEEGTEMYDLKKVINMLGFRGYCRCNISLEQLIQKLDKNIPIIVGFMEHWQIVIGYNEKYIFLADPNHTKPIRITKKRFLKLWRTEGSQTLEIG